MSSRNRTELEGSVCAEPWASFVPESPSHRQNHLATPLWALAIGLVLFSCADPQPTQECLTEADCETGEACVNNRCVSAAPDLVTDGDLDGDRNGSAEDPPDFEFDEIDLGRDPSTLKEQGEPCDHDSECEGNICLPTGNADGSLGICTEPCNSDGRCSDGYVCRTLSLGGPDIERICVPDKLCDSCSDDFDCLDVGRNFCEELDNGDFCLTNCEESRTCPDPNPDDDVTPYECNPVSIEGGGPDGEDVETFLCYPTSNVCSPIRLVGGAFVSTPTIIRAPNNAPTRFRLSGYITSTPGVSEGGTFHLSGGL